MSFPVHPLIIPPFLSTTWDQVASLALRPSAQNSPHILQITLKSGASVEIPGLSEPVILDLFEQHNRFLKEISKPSPLSIENNLALMDAIPPGASIELLLPGLEHNFTMTSQAQVPQEILEKMRLFIHTMRDQILAQGGTVRLPKDEPHCNCPHCQIARALTLEQTTTETKALVTPKEESENPIDEGELVFRSWEIENVGDNLYRVFDTQGKESYQVCVGEIEGCTCGQKNCEHLQIVKNR